MSYLFGDSTTSPFRINYIEFLRLAIGFSVHVLRVERRVLTERSRRSSLEVGVETDRRRLQQLLAAFTDVIRREATGAEPRVGKVAQDLEEKSLQVVEAGLQSLTASLAQELEAIEKGIQVERKSTVEALEKLVLQYDLPDARNAVHVRLADGRYSAWLESATPYGLETLIELAIPPESGFVHDARVDRFSEALELHAPETSGWLRKESRMMPHKVGRFFIVELDVEEDETSIKLRSSTEPNATGYDIVVRREEPRVRMTRAGKDVDASAPFDVEDADVPNVVRFRDKVVEAAQFLTSQRRTLVSAQLAEKPVQESEGMRGLIEQLVRVLAPSVREISARSLLRSELVLRRMIGDDRREEIFVGRSELRAKVAELGDEEDRRIFDPLELNEPASDRSARPSKRPNGISESTPPPPFQARN
jgi:hypothetical protein